MRLQTFSNVVAASLGLLGAALVARSLSLAGGGLHAPSLEALRWLLSLAATRLDVLAGILALALALLIESATLLLARHCEIIVPQPSGVMLATIAALGLVLIMSLIDREWRDYAHLEIGEFASECWQAEGALAELPAAEAEHLSTLAREVLSGGRAVSKSRLARIKQTADYAAWAAFEGAEEPEPARGHR